MSKNYLYVEQSTSICLFFAYLQMSYLRRPLSTCFPKKNTFFRDPFILFPGSFDLFECDKANAIISAVEQWRQHKGTRRKWKQLKINKISFNRVCKWTVGYWTDSKIKLYLEHNIQVHASQHYSITRCSADSMLNSEYVWIDECFYGGSGFFSSYFYLVWMRSSSLSEVKMKPNTKI